MGWWSKVKKGFKKAKNAVTKAVKDTGKFCAKNSGIISAIGAVAGTVLTGGLAGPLVGAALGGMSKFTDTAKKVADTAKTVSGITNSIGSIAGAIPSGGQPSSNNAASISGDNDAVNYGGDVSRSASSGTGGKMTPETKKKITLGGAALAALSLLKFVK